jgi:transcriptional regulator with XRE-family HTH domain
MSTKKKSDAVKFLENLSGGALTFGTLLESIREGEEISQVAFAKKLKISKAHLCDLEKGRRLPSPSRAAKFAKILGYSPERFVKVTLLAPQRLEAFCKQLERRSIMWMCVRLRKFFFIQQLKLEPRRRIELPTPALRIRLRLFAKSIKIITFFN